MSDDDFNFLARMSAAAQVADPRLSGSDFLRLMQLAGLEGTAAYRLTLQHVCPVELGRVDRSHILEIIEWAHAVDLEMSVV